MLFLMFILVTLFVLGCRGSGKVVSATVVDELSLLKNVELNSEMVDIAADGNRLLLLEASGTRVLVLDSGLTVVETIPLANRLILPRGMSVDRYYIYLYDDNTLYRLAKDKLTMSAWLNNVRVGGLAVYSPGEMLVSEQKEQLVLLKTLFGESRIFLDRGEVVQPGKLVVFPDGFWGVLSASGWLIKINRAGIEVNKWRVPVGADLLAGDKYGRALIAGRTQSNIWVVDDKRIDCYGLKGVTNPVAIAVTGDFLCVLDSGRRVLVYLLPGR